MHDRLKSKTGVTVPAYAGTRPTVLVYRSLYLQYIISCAVLNNLSAQKHKLAR